MPRYTYRPIANGLRTDHPIPDLGFVDDSHIPLDDPVAIEAIGRHPGSDMWGREDRCRDGGWVAFTTDPLRHDLGWCVRWHPEHGRSVVLYRDDDTSAVHTVLGGPALLFRSGGYWWDGTTWYRPAQVWDAAGESYYRRPVPAATTATATDLLDDSGRPGRAHVWSITSIDPDTPLTPTHWADDLALWASHRPDTAHLDWCVVKVTAPELTGDQLIGTAQMATVAGMSASTLRAYISRGEGDVPLPQAVLGNRSLWSRPVAEEWAEQRRRSHEGVTESVSTDQTGAPHPVGVADLLDRFTRTFFTRMWERPDYRKRWALRWRTKASVEEIAQDLAWGVAANLRTIIPVSALGTTIRQAILDEFATGQQLDHSIHGRKAKEAAERQSVPEPAPVFYGIDHSIALTLGWLIRHEPAIGRRVIGEIVGEAERRLGVPRPVSQQSIGTALSLEGKLDADTLDDFLDRVFDPSHTET